MSLLSAALAALRAREPQQSQPEPQAFAGLTREQCAAVDDQAELNAWPVTVPDQFNEFESLGYLNHRPLRPLLPRQWLGIERRREAQQPQEDANV